MTRNIQGQSRRMRQRGSFMLEAILAIGVAISLIGLTAGFISDEKDKQENILIASEVEIALAAARGYVSDHYVDVRADLYDASTTSPSNEAVMTISVQDLIDAGYLPASFATEGILRTMYGQDYALIARGVRRDDMSNPKNTLDFGQMDDGGHLRADYSDGDRTNDEMEIESLLVTYGGVSIPVGVGSNAISRFNTSFGGFVAQPDETRGPYANFSLDITPFMALSEYPDIGHFASIVSLSNFGVLGPDGQLTEDIDHDYLHRCQGLTIDSPESDTCGGAGNNDVYNDIVFAPWDSNLDGANDVFPALRGVTNVKCALDGSSDPIDATATPAMNAFLVDCRTTKLNGSLEAFENISARGNVLATGELAAGNGLFKATGTQIFLNPDTDPTHADAIAVRKGSENMLVGDRVVLGNVSTDGSATVTGRDLSEAVLDSRIVRPGDSVKKPVCTGQALDDPSKALVPRIYTTPSVYASEDGDAIVGVEAYAVDDPSDPDAWVVKMYLYIDKDSNGDSSADRVAVGPDFGGVLVQTRCY